MLVPEGPLLATQGVPRGATIFLRFFIPLKITDREAPDLGGSMSWRRFHIHDHAMLDINQVVRRVREEPRTSWHCGPTRKRISQRQALGQCFGQSFFIQRFKVFTDGASTKRRIAPVDLFISGYATSPTGVRLDDARAHSKTFALDQTGVHAATQHFVEQPAKQRAVAKTKRAAIGERQNPSGFTLRDSASKSLSASDLAL